VWLWSRSFALLACYDEVGVTISVRGEDDDVVPVGMCGPCSVCSNSGLAMPLWPRAPLALAAIICAENQP
jgi:hypothetical protein